MFPEEKDVRPGLHPGWASWLVVPMSTLQWFTHHWGSVVLTPPSERWGVQCPLICTLHQLYDLLLIIYLFIYFNLLIFLCIMDIKLLSNPYWIKARRNRNFCGAINNIYFLCILIYYPYIIYIFFIYTVYIPVEPMMSHRSWPGQGILLGWGLLTEGLGFV